MIDTTDQLIDQVTLELKSDARQYVAAWLAKQREDIRREEKAVYTQLAQQIQATGDHLTKELNQAKNQIAQFTFVYTQVLGEWLAERGLSKEWLQYLEQRLEEKNDEDL